MEHKLTINLLPWREKKARLKKIFRGCLAAVIILLTVFILFFVYQKEEKSEKVATTKIENPLAQKAFQAKQEWGFLTIFFDAISNKLPKDMMVISTSQEENGIILNASTPNPKSLTDLLSLLKKQWAKNSIKLSTLSEKSVLNFTILIKPSFKPGEASFNSAPFDSSTWSNAIAAFARKENLLIEIKPTETGTQLILQGNYKNLLRFLFHLKQSSWPVLINTWQLRPEKNHLLLEINVEVIHK